MSKVTSTSKTQDPSQGTVEASLKSKSHRRVLQERTGSEINKSGGQQKQSSLIGSKGFLQISKDAKSGKSGGNGGLFVFKDENVGVKTKKDSPAKLIHTHVQTVVSGDYGSVTDADVAFYKELAEKRREALDESLKENESLVMENDELRLENAELQSENKSLQESVEKARKITDMLAPILANSDDEDDDEDEKEEVTESSDAPSDAKESHDDKDEESSNQETAEETQSEQEGH